MAREGAWNDLESELDDLNSLMKMHCCFRAVVRGLPFLSEGVTGKSNTTNSDLLLPLFRCAHVAELTLYRSSQSILSAASRAAYWESNIGGKTEPSVGASSSIRAIGRLAATGASSAASDAVYHARSAVQDLSAFWGEFNADLKSADLDFITSKWKAGDLNVGGVPLWSRQVPEVVKAAEQRLLSQLRADPDLDYWAIWYARVAAAKPAEPEFLERIVLMDDEIWTAGSRKIAKKIEEIDRILPRRHHSASSLLSQSERLLAQPAITELVARQLAVQVEEALASHANSGKNQIPEELGTLERLPRTLRAISHQAASTQTREEKLTRMSDLLASHASEIENLTRALEELRGDSQKRVFREAFLEQAGKSLGDWKLYAAVLTGTYAILGGEIFGVTAESLAHSAKEIFANKERVSAAP